MENQCGPDILRDIGMSIPLINRLLFHAVPHLGKYRKQISGDINSLSVIKSRGKVWYFNGVFGILLCLCLYSYPHKHTGGFIIINSKYFSFSDWPANPPTNS